jgi:membrane-associated phospholipid phosphatase
MAAFAVASAVSFEAQERDSRRTGLIAGATLSAASLVGISRIYQQHHWLSDVLVGAAVGAGAGFLASRLPARVWQPASAR